MVDIINEKEHILLDKLYENSVTNERLLADWYCCVAGFMPGSTFETVGEIITKMVDGADIYGSVTYNDFFFNTSKTKAELTLSGSYNEE